MVEMDWAGLCTPLKPKNGLNGEPNCFTAPQNHPEMLARWLLLGDFHSKSKIHSPSVNSVACFSKLSLRFRLLPKSKFDFSNHNEVIPRCY